MKPHKCLLIFICSFNGGNNRAEGTVIAAYAVGLLRGSPDIAFATLARFGHNLGRVYWDAAKRVLRYLKGTKQC